MLVRRSGGQWEKPPIQSYNNEDELQTLVAGSPELVWPDRTVVAVRELSIPEAGSLDVLLIGLEGGMTLVEAKLNRNAEIRRAVVGQLLGYAGGLWRMSYDDLDAVVRDREGASLVDLARAAAGEEEFRSDEFRSALATNLREGAFRLVFVVDGISEDLRRAVEYLNAHSVDSVEVVVLELGYSKVDDVEILVPNTFGEEAARRKHATRTRRRWSKDDFLDALAEHSHSAEADLARRLHEWAEPRVAWFYYGEGQTPGCTMGFSVPEGDIQPISIFFMSSGLGIAVNFEWIRKRPREAREEFLDRLTALPTIAGLRDEIIGKDFAKRPTISASEFDGRSFETLTVAIEALLAHPGTS